MSARTADRDEPRPSDGPPRTAPNSDPDAAPGIPALVDLLAALPMAMAILDATGHVITASPGFSLCPPGAGQETGGPGPGDDFDAYCLKALPGGAAGDLRSALAAVLSGQIARASFELPADDKARHPRRTLGVTAIGGPPGGAVVAYKDDSRIKELEEHILHDAFHDTLTGLFNRSLFLNRLEQAIQRLKRNPRQTYAVLYLDIDRFKLVNKTFGHVTGDRLLMVVANRLLKLVRTVDTLARFGGDEFAILLDDVDGREGATAAAERVLTQLSMPYRLRRQDISITSSIGVVLGSPAYEHPDQILRDADNAMYWSKEHGGNHFTVFEDGMHVMTRKRMELELDLRGAVEAGQISVRYQPIVCLESGRVTGFEALLRWRHPERGMIPPVEFIPIAEESGIIHALGDFVLQNACDSLAGLRRRQPKAADGLTMNVNISAKQFKRPEFVDEVAAIVASSGVEPGAIKLELTESVLLEDADAAVTTIRRLKDLGFGVVIDDFGTGYSSLSYIQRFPFDSLKVDRSFVGAMNEAGQNMQIVRTIIAMAHGLGLHVVAEGVELAEHRDLLNGLDCESAQGFLFSRPITEDEMEPLLLKNFS